MHEKTDKVNVQYNQISNSSRG